MALISTLADDFNDNAVDGAKWPNSFGTYSETGGRARVTCDTGFNAYSSALNWTLAESSVYLQAFAPAAGGATTEAWAQVLVKSSTGGTDLGFELRALTGQLVMFNRNGFFDPGAVAITYDPVAHAWLRVRETGGTTFWDTSPDTFTWTNQRSLTSPAWVGDTNIEFQLIAHRSDGVVDFAEFDNVNTPPVTGGASLAAAAALAADGVRGMQGAASLGATGSLAAAGARGATSGASLAATVASTAGGLVQKEANAAAAVSANLSAGGQLGLADGAALPVAATATAAGAAGRAASGTVTVSAVLQSSGQVAVAVMAGKARAGAGATSVSRRGTPSVARARGGSGP